MSGPLTMTAEQADALGRFLGFLTKATLETGCELTPYTVGQIRLPGTTDDGKQWNCLEFVWDPGLAQYRIDDRIGS